MLLLALLQTTSLLAQNTYTYGYDADGNPMPSDDVFKMVGGQVYDFLKMKKAEKPGTTLNACALRMSVAFNDSGFDIPDLGVDGDGNQIAFKGANGKNYILSAKNFGNYIANNLKWEKFGGKSIYNPWLTSAMKKTKGFYFMEPRSPRDWEATGHVTLVNKGNFLGKSYLKHTQFYKYTFWELP